jgi:hypothetical protein
MYPPSKQAISARRRGVSPGIPLAVLAGHEEVEPMARINRGMLQYIGFEHGAGNAWYFHYNGYRDTHLHLGASGGGDSLQIDFLSMKLEDDRCGNFEQYPDGKFSVSKLEGIRAKYYMTAGAAFRKAINELNQYVY